MRRKRNSGRGFRFPPEIIAQAVWLYHCFSLGLRDIELILAALASAATMKHWSVISLRRAEPPRVCRRL
jgi:putative transposase